MVIVPRYVCFYFLALSLLISDKSIEVFFVTFLKERKKFMDRGTWRVTFPDQLLICSTEAGLQEMKLLKQKPHPKNGPSGGGSKLALKKNITDTHKSYTQKKIFPWRCLTHGRTTRGRIQTDRRRHTRRDFAHRCYIRGRVTHGE